MVVGGQVEGDLASREHVHSVLPRVAARMAFHYLKEVTMKVDRVLHHRVVDEGHTDALIPSEADRLDDLAELPSVERPHESLHVAREVDLKGPRRPAPIRIELERDEIGVDQHLVR